MRRKNNVSRYIFWGTLAAGVTAAYLMTRRGASFGEVASKTLTNPVGTLVTELKSAIFPAPGSREPQITA